MTWLQWILLVVLLWAVALGLLVVWIRGASVARDDWPEAPAAERERL